MLILRQKSFKFCTPRLKTQQPVLPYCVFVLQIANTYPKAINYKIMYNYQNSNQLNENTLTKITFLLAKNGKIK